MPGLLDALTTLEIDKLTYVKPTQTDPAGESEFMLNYFIIESHTVSTLIKTFPIFMEGHQKIDCLLQSTWKGSEICYM